MKKKVLISIVGIALFAVAIGFGLNNTQEDNLKVKNIEALAGPYNYPVNCCDYGANGTCTFADHSTADGINYLIMDQESIEPWEGVC